MEILEIQAQAKSPYVNFDPNAGLMVIKGMSSAENSLDFYRPILIWIDEFAKNITTEEVKVDIYFNHPIPGVLIPRYYKRVQKTVCLSKKSGAKHSGVKYEPC